MSLTNVRVVLPFLVLFLSPLLGAAEPKVARGIPYAQPKQEKQALDVYAPGAGKNHPVAIWIHGGGWHSGDKKDESGNQKLADRDKQRFGDEQLQKEMSSVTYVARGKHIPPFLILHVADHPDTTGQSQRLFRALQEADVPARIYPAEGKNHKTINED